MPTTEVEGRIGKFEGITQQISERLNHLETVVEAMRKDLSAKIDANAVKIDDLRKDLSAKIDANFKWILGIMIPMWVTIVLTILFSNLVLNRTYFLFGI
jgi:hypothetical protein